MTVSAPQDPGRRAPSTADEIAQAAAALRAGGLVAVPTETVFGLAASAASADGVRSLAEAMPAPPEHVRRGQAPAPLDDAAAGDIQRPPRTFTWHAADAASVLEVVEPDTVVQHRLITRLLPGPVRLLIEQPADRLAAARERLGVAPGVIEDGVELSVRVPDHAIAAALARETREPMVAEQLSAAGWATPDGRSPAGAPDGLGVLAGPPSPSGTPSSTVRLASGGRWEVVQERAMSTADIQARAARLVVLVCTGNTCRSPMARALLEERLRRRPIDGVQTRVLSAGVHAARQEPASPQAVEVMRERGLDLTEHRSAPLDAIAELPRAEWVFVMSQRHADGVRQLAPDLGDRVRLLDPNEPIPDPFGGPVEEYREAAERIDRLLGERLEEMDRALRTR